MEQLVNAAENFAREENLTPVVIPTMSKDMDEQLKLSHKVVDILNRANRKIRVTLLPKSNFLQARRRTRSFNELSMWFINLKNLSIYLMYWALIMMKFLLINPSVMFSKK